MLEQTGPAFWGDRTAMGRIWGGVGAEASADKSCLSATEASRSNRALGLRECWAHALAFILERSLQEHLPRGLICSD